MRRDRLSVKAGSFKSLPFLLYAGLLLSANLQLKSVVTNLLEFQKFGSSCIDLGGYDTSRKTLTVRFVNRDKSRFYCYTNVPPEIWKNLERLNQNGRRWRVSERNGCAAARKVSVQGTHNPVIQIHPETKKKGRRLKMNLRPS